MKTVATLSLWILLAATLTGAAPMDGAPLQKPLPQNLWVEMAKRVNPGVVGIFVEMKPRKGRASRRRLQRDPLFDVLEELFGGEMDFQTPAHPSQESKPIGTGFVIKANGLIVTNYHVAEAAEKYHLKVSVPNRDGKDSELADAKIVGLDKRGDIALLKVETKTPLTPLQLGSSKSLQVGQYVAAFGNPFGHSNSMTVGILSAIGRNLKEINRFPFLQTDASINPGNSGGPLLDTNGYVIGVNTAIDARAQGIGFAIPIDYVKGILPTLEKGQNVKRGFLGISLRTLSPGMARELGVPGQRGVYVNSVGANTPAKRAGIQRGDIITGFNSEKIVYQDDLIQNVQDAPVGSQAQVKIMRLSSSGQAQKLTLPLAIGVFPEEGGGLSSQPIPAPQSPSAKPAKKSKFYSSSSAPFNLGFGITDSSSGARKYYDVPINSPFGPIITQVNLNGPADKAGLEQGDVLLEVNGENAVNVKTALTLFKPSSNKLKLSRNGQDLTVFMKK